MIDLIESTAGIAPDLNVNAPDLAARVESDLFHLPDEPSAYHRALRQVALAYPIGHLSVYPAVGCGSALPIVSTSVVGACTQPYQDHAIVTNVDAANPLGLLPGDEIVAIDGVTGDAMMKQALEQPMCASSSASESNRRYTSATSLFAGVKVGASVRVRVGLGDIEERVVKKTRPARSCRDPWGRGSSSLATGEVRPDGVGVVRVSRLHLGSAAAGKTTDEIVSAIREQLRNAFQVVSAAPAIVWDFRANEGGSTYNGLEIVAGWTGAAHGVDLGGYRYRSPGTKTYTERTAYVLSPGGEFAYGGRVALVIDGLTISAADYTARAARMLTTAKIVGAASSGSFGGGVNPIELGTGSMTAYVSPDPYKADDKDGSLLEGKAVEPTDPVELDPKDVAKGRDTVLERAVELVK